MAFKITDPIFKSFDLEKTDLAYPSEDGKPTTVLIKQARQHEHATRQDQWNKFERRYSSADPDNISIIQELSFEAIKMLEARMVLAESNILDESGKKLLFPSKKDDQGHSILDMKAKEFEIAWGSLPTDVAQEIHDKIIELNPMWGSSLGEKR